MPVVATYTNPEDAHLAVSLLGGNGIDAWVTDENTASLYWFYSNAIGGVKVEVAEADTEAARDVLQLPKIADTESPPLLACPVCGSRNVRLRKLNVFTGLCLVFYLPLPFASRKADCFDCGRKLRLDRQGALHAI